MEIDVTTKIDFLAVVKAVETFSRLQPSTLGELELIPLEWYAEQLEASAKRIRKRIEDVDNLPKFKDIIGLYAEDDKDG